MSGDAASNLAALQAGADGLAARPPVIAYIGLGANLGDRAATMRAALAALGATPGILVEAASSLRETEPVGGPPGQPPYLNGAARLRTTLAPHALLARLLAIEAAFGRVRAERFGPRTLDLDLLLYGDEVLDDPPTLLVPHPRLCLRRFVLEPLCELDPDLTVPDVGGGPPRPARALVDALR